MKDKNKTREQLINELTGLRQRLAGSQDLEARCKKVKQALRESENKYRQLFLAETDAIVLFDAETLQFIDINNAAQSLYGYTKEEFLKLKIQDISAEVEETIGSIAKTCQGNVTRIRCRYHRKKDGTVFPVEISPGFFKLRDYKVICGVIRDITERKKMEDVLKKAQVELESRIKERTEELARANEELLVQKLSLEQKNIALTEIVKQIEVEKSRIKDDIANNVNELLFPILAKLRIKGASSKYIDLLQHNLKELSSSFGRIITGKSIKLSPREIEICNMVKNGLSTKETSNLLNLSHQTVEKHRKNIRYKLKITNKSINLATFLRQP